MDINIKVLKKSALFTDIAEKDITSMLNCLMMKQKKYDKNEYIIDSTKKIYEVGIVLSGRINIIREDYWGNRNILTTLEKGELFGEAFACTQTNLNLFSIVAAEKCEILFLNYQKIISPCHRACIFHSQLIQNMLYLVAKKNIMLTTKIEHLTQKTTRKKILSYLSSIAIKQGSNIFTIPFNRQELADFLSVERSAMSAELSKMQKDGLIEYHKNNFKLL